MPRDEDKSTIDVHLTGERDPQDPDGLLTVEQAENTPDPAAYGEPDPEPAVGTDSRNREDPPPGQARE